MLLIVFVLISQAFAEGSGNLTLDQIKRYALEHNYGIKAAEASRDEVQAQGVQARSAFLPKLSVIAGPEMIRDGTQSKSEAIAHV